MRARWSLVPFVALLLCLGTAPAAAAERWVASWAHPLVGEQGGDPGGDAVIRTVARLSLGGPRLRLRLSNAFGTAPLRIDAARVARTIGPGSDAIDPASDRVVTFGGSGEAVIPPGADYLSDPVDLPVQALGAVAVTFHLPQAPATSTSLPAPRGFSFVAHGATGAEATLPGARPLARTHHLAGIHVEGGPGTGAVAALGDSITAAGGGSLIGRGRWTDVLAARLQASPRRRRMGVLNLGVSGGRVAEEGTGPAAVARLDRDVLSQPGLSALIVSEDVNDLGKLSREAPATPENRAAVVRAVIEGYRQIVARARDRRMRVLGATIPPFSGTLTSRSDADAEADRRAVNAWIRTRPFRRGDRPRRGDARSRPPRTAQPRL